MQSESSPHATLVEPSIERSTQQSAPRPGRVTRIVALLSVGGRLTPLLGAFTTESLLVGGCHVLVAIDTIRDDLK